MISSSDGSCDVNGGVLRSSTVEEEFSIILLFDAEEERDSSVSLSGVSVVEWNMVVGEQIRGSK